MDWPLAPVKAFVDHRRYGVLPRAGGTFDQDPELLEELELVAVIVEAAEKAAAARSRR